MFRPEADGEGFVTEYIPYEDLTHAAMRGVIREAIRTAEGNCQTPGDHHFYITFRTRAPGVQIADHLVEQFPDSMTIVVQHQFWDLEVHDQNFEIVLKFSGVPQHLNIPFSAITRFVDPSVNFGLSFEDQTTTSNQNSVVDPVLAGETTGEAGDMPDHGGETVVNLDAFRRK